MHQEVRGGWQVASSVILCLISLSPSEPQQKLIVLAGLAGQQALKIHLPQPTAHHTPRPPPASPSLLLGLQACVTIIHLYVVLGFETQVLIQCSYH